MAQSLLHVPSNVVPWFSLINRNAKWIIMHLLRYGLYERARYNASYVGEYVSTNSHTSHQTDTLQGAALDNGNMIATTRNHTEKYRPR